MVKTLILESGNEGFLFVCCYAFWIEQERIIRQSPGFSMNPVRLGDEYWVQSPTKIVEKVVKDWLSVPIPTLKIAEF
jgi:hypothetical protein